MTTLALAPATGRARPRPAGRALADRVGLAVASLIVVTWAAAPLIGFRSALAVLTVTGYVAALVGVYRPAVGLLGVTVLCVLDGPSRVYLLTGGLWRWNTLNYWLLAAMLLFAPTLLRLRDIHSRLLLLFAAVLAAGLVISPDLALGVQQIVNVVTGVGLTLYFLRARDDPSVGFWLAACGGLLGAGGGLAFYLLRDELASINPNAWALFPLTAILAICLGFPSAARRPRGQTMLMPLAAANLVWIFLSGSRGTLLMAACCMLALLVSLRGIANRVVALTAASVVGIAAASQFSDLQATAVQRLERLVGAGRPLAATPSLSNRTSGRSDLAIGGWYLFTEHPLGVGTGGFPKAWRDLGVRANMTNFGQGKEKSAHSGWILTLAENGVPGFAALLAWLASFGIAGLRARDRDVRLIGVLTSVVLAAALVSTEFQSKGLWFLAAGAAVTLGYRRAPALGEAGLRRRAPVDR